MRSQNRHYFFDMELIEVEVFGYPMLEVAFGVAVWFLGLWLYGKVRSRGRY